MTYQINQNFSSDPVHFATDLDENIHSINVEYDEQDGDVKTYYFDNPVTGSTDMVSFFEKYDVAPILYVPNYSVGKRLKWSDQIECHDLKDLYDMILIEEE